jgi:IclR family acetate operon transcriptional repressor
MRISSKTPAYPIQSVEHALSLIDLFAEKRRLTVGGISKIINVAPSTATRLVAMLQAFGYVERQADSRAYVIGNKLRDVGLEAVRELDVRVQMRPFLEVLSAETGETVSVGILLGQTVVFLDCIEGRHRSHVSSRVGELLPAHSLSTGKALLAELTCEDFLALYPRETLSAVTPRTMTTRSLVQNDLAQITRRGYATAFRESDEELSAIAVSVRDVIGRTRFAVSIAAPASRLTPKSLEKYAGLVQAAGRAMAEALL